MTLEWLYAQFQSLSSIVQQLLGRPIVQSGTAQLINGSIAVILGANKLNANSSITITMRDALAGGGAITGFASFDARPAGRNFTTGAFLVRAIDDADAQIGTAQSSFDYVVVTPL